MKYFWIGLIVLVLFVLGFFGIKWVRVFTASDYDQMLTALYSNTVPLLKAEQINMDDYLVLDSRAANERAVSYIQNSVWVDYPNPNLTVVQDLPKDRAILVYCSIGYRSERVGETLISMGFTRVYNLYGGIFEWANNEHPLVDAENKSTNKVHGFDQSWGKWLDKEVEVVYD